MDLNWKQVSVHMAGAIFVLLPALVVASWITFGMPAVEFSEAGFGAIAEKLGPAVISYMFISALIAFLGKSISRLVRPSSKLLSPIVCSAILAIVLFMGLLWFSAGHLTFVYFDRIVAIIALSALMTVHFRVIDLFEMRRQQNQ